MLAMKGKKSPSQRDNTNPQIVHVKFRSLMHKEGTDWSHELFIMPFPKKLLGDLESERSVSRISNNAVVSFSLGITRRMLWCGHVFLNFAKLNRGEFEFHCRNG